MSEERIDKLLTKYATEKVDIHSRFLKEFYDTKVSERRRSGYDPRDKFGRHLSK